MKKKILLISLMVALFVCILAISVSAEGIKRFATDEFQSGDNITYIEGIDLGAYYNSSNRGKPITDLYDSGNVARIVLKNSDGTYTTYPTYYFIRLQDDWQGDYQFVFCTRVNDMASVTGETYTNESIIRIEYPELNPAHPFGKLSANVEKVNSYKNLKYVYISSQFKHINSSFDGLTSLETLEFAPNAQIATVGQFSFRRTNIITKIIFPNSLQSLHKEALQGCSALTELSLGAGFNKFNDKQSLTTLGTANQVRIYVPSTLDGATYGASYFPSKAIIMFTGDKNAALAFGFSAAMSYEEFVAAGSVAADGTIIYDYNLCDAFYGGKHTDGQVLNSCQVGCGRQCGKAELIENPQHILSMSETRGERGFFDAIRVVEQCANCKTKTIDDEIAPILEWKGYSVCTYTDKYAVVQSFKINKQAAESYKKYESDLEIGFIATVNTTDNAINPFENEKIITDVARGEFDCFDIKISGISDALKDAKLIFCLYVKADGKTVYADNGVTVSTLAGTSYTEVYNSIQQD